MMTRSSRSFRAAALACLISGALLFAASCGGDDTSRPKSTRTEIIELSETELLFSTDAGAADPAAQIVSVINSGPGTLSDLGVTISYGSGQPTEWLSAVLTDTTAPTEITLQAMTGGGTLGAGSYAATVSVASARAKNSPKSIAVTFDVLARFGFFDEFISGQSRSANFLQGIRFAVDAVSTLTHLCLIAKNPAWSQVKLGLYTDLGGQPNLLIASTPATIIDMARMEMPVTAVELPVGDYWLMAVYNTGTLIGYHSGTQVWTRSTAHSFAEELPTIYPAEAAPYMAPAFNYYIKARVP